MLFSPRKARVRLLRAGDTVNPNRTGKKFPDLLDLPEQYHELVEWAKKQFQQSAKIESGYDILRRIRGTYRYTAEGQSVEDYVRELRKGWD